MNFYVKMVIYSPGILQAGIGAGAGYNHARLKNKKALPRDNPVDAVGRDRERRRNTGMGAGDLPRWFEELARLDNPVRREFHLLTLLSGVIRLSPALICPF